jgi:hypothetical protein
VLAEIPGSLWGFHGVVMGQLHYLRMVSVFVQVTLLKCKVNVLLTFGIAYMQISCEIFAYQFEKWFDSKLCGYI